jgi:predicted nucleic acid-binding protein
MIDVVVVIGVFALLAGIAAAIFQFLRWREMRKRQLAEANPLRTLELQLRLADVAEEIRRLENGDGFAKAHHLRAAQAAYDALLAEACRRAGVGAELSGVASTTRSKPATEDTRFGMELALCSRGWSW